jgi:protein O-mannosyl-transferase
LVFLALAFLLYGNTIGHEYALDDRIVIVDNQFTRQGWTGIVPILSNDSFVGFFGVHKALVAGGRYRPLSIVTFAIEQQLFGDDPHLRHAINVILYGLTGWLLYLVLRRLLPPSPPGRWFLDPSLVAALLFTAHPVHTEVVANIKGRDEILALLCALGSLLLQIRHLERRRAVDLVGAGVLFLLALLSKESTLPLLAVFPVALWFFRPESRGGRLRSALVCLVAAIAYFALRQIVTGQPAVPGRPEILNDPFLGATLAQRTATVFRALLEYLRLLVVPHPLTHDYFYDHVPLVDWRHPAPIVSLGIHLGLIGAAVVGARRKDPAAFGVLAYLLSISVVSNLLVSVGVIMAERFLYVPSVGAAVAAAWLFHRGAGAAAAVGRAQWAGAVLVLLLCLWGFATVRRNAAWHDDRTLFETDVRTSPRSTKLRTALGGTLLEASGRATPAEARRLRDSAIVHLRRAVEIYPGYGQAWLLLGNAYAQDGATRVSAIEAYRRAIEAWPGLALAYINLGLVYRQLGDFAVAAQTSRALLAQDPRSAEGWVQLGLTYEQWGKPDSALAAYESAVAADTSSTVALARLGTAQGRFRGDLETAVRHLERAVRKGNQEDWVFDNLGVALGSLGRYPEAIAALQEGLRHHPGSRKLEMSLLTTYRLAGDARARELEARIGATSGGPP